MYELGGWLQWKFVTSKQWYTMHCAAIKPDTMKKRFWDEYLPQLETNSGAIKIRGRWNKETKKMTIESFVEWVG